MKNGYKAVKGLVYNYPLLLLQHENTNLEKYIDTFLPYSFGLEIETKRIDTEVINFYSQLNKLSDEGYLLSRSNLHGSSELRFRFPHGIKGFVGLYKVLELVQNYTYFNEGSGIHIHVDFTDFVINIHNLLEKFFKRYIIKQSLFKKALTSIPHDIPFSSRHRYQHSDFTSMEKLVKLYYSYINQSCSNISGNFVTKDRLVDFMIFHGIPDSNNGIKSKITNFNEYLLQQLDKLEYNGLYNRRQILLGKNHVWMNYRQTMCTAEIRILKMTYDYSNLIEKIIFIQDLMRKVKKFYIKLHIEFLSDPNYRTCLQVAYKDELTVLHTIFEEKFKKKKKVTTRKRYVVDSILPF